MTAPVADGAFAGWLAGRAGDLLLALRTQLGFADPAALRGAGDKRSHELITTELARWRPDDAVLSEEGARTDPARLAAERVWIVDPLDGTREFAEAGRDDWAVHVGLWSRAADGLVAGAVRLPARDQVFATDEPPPYPPATRPVRAEAGGAGPVRMAVSRSRPPAFLTALAEAVGAETVPMGSAGAKIVSVVTGEVDAYVHAGGQHEWDSAAPVAVALAAGLHASRIDGSPLRYNQADPRLPDLVVCRTDLAPRLLAALAGILT